MNEWIFILRLDRLYRHAGFSYDCNRVTVTLSRQCDSAQQVQFSRPLLFVCLQDRKYHVIEIMYNSIWIYKPQRIYEQCLKKTT